MSNVTNEEKFEQLEKSNKVILGVANQYLESQQSNSNKEIENTIKTIDGEIEKIINKEFTIAVVGEVKAGKSTFINALVGYDISHSRTKAATTYPVRLKHKKNHNKSSIRLDVLDVFWNHVKKVKNTLEQEDFSNNVDLADFKSTMNYVKADNFTSENYNQDNLEIEEVRKLLEILHDLPRVSKIILPNLDIENITKNVIPEISLEFPTIRLNADNQEGVILIDTPGLGEGSDVNTFIESTIETEIQKASAVMAVLAKGGRGSASEKQVADFMKKTSSSYVIAGKMDDYNNDGNDTPIDELLSNLQQQFNKFNCKKVFAIAQHQAVQAINVQDYFDKHGKLEDPHNSNNFEKHPSYTILSDEYGKKDLRKINNQEEGYEELLSGDFKETILEMLNPEKYPFTKITDEFQDLASNVLENTLHSSIIKFTNNKNGTSDTLNTMISNDLIIIQEGAETAQKTLELMKDIKTKMDYANSDIDSKISKQKDEIETFKTDLNTNTLFALDKLIIACKQKITKSELEHNEKIKKKNKGLVANVLSLLDNDSVQQSKNYSKTDEEPEEPAQDFILRTCEELVDDMQRKAVDEIQNIKEIFSKLSNDARNQLSHIAKDYKTILEDSYKEIKLPELDVYIKVENSSIDGKVVKTLVNQSTQEKKEYYDDKEWCLNPLTLFRKTTRKSYTYDVFDVGKFYGNLKITIKPAIQNIFTHIELNVGKNITKIECFKKDLNDQIESMMSKLQDMDKYSNDIKLAEKIKKDYAEFLNIIDNEIERISKMSS